jgi:threonine aldolase
MQTQVFFASDNNSGAHPRIMQALAAVNQGSVSSYGEDPITERAIASVRREFGPTARPWFVFLGTAANVLGLKTMLRTHEGALCSSEAHLFCDECGAPEAITGSRLLPLPAHHGKIHTEDCLKFLAMRPDVHRTYPRVLCITQSTECGTVYTRQELLAIRDFCRQHDLYLHMDGARLCNAAAALGVSLREISTDVGVDVLSFGGTKNGLMIGEAVVFLNDELGHSFGHVRKQLLQLGSKMRYISAQFLEYLRDELWRENALHANAMAALLAGEIQDCGHVRIVHPVQVNAVFARMPKKLIAKLRERFYFYTLDDAPAEGFPEDWHLVRLMTAFDTREEDVMMFAEAIRRG